MQIQVSGHGVAVTDAIRDHAVRCLLFALSRFGASVRKVSVELLELPELRARGCMGCRMKASLEQGSEIAIEESDSDLNTLIDRLARRLGRAVNRAVARLRGSTGPDSPRGRGLP